MEMDLDLHFKLSPACLAHFIGRLRYDSVIIGVAVMESELNLFDVAANMKGCYDYSPIGSLRSPFSSEKIQEKIREICFSRNRKSVPTDDRHTFFIIRMKVKQVTGAVFGGIFELKIGLLVHSVT